MRITVLLFGPEAAAAGTDRVAVEAPAAVTCGDLRGLLAERIPALRPYLAGARFAVNHEFADPARPVSESDEVALIGLVSGG